MQSNSYHNRPSQGPNAELYHEYQEVFRVLDNLGMTDLKRTFQEHCIQDQTLSYVETEDELKQILREIGIPLGRCIPIMKSWSKRYSSQEQVKKPVKVPMVDKSSQTAMDVIDASIQTDDIFITATDYNRIMADMNSQELLNHYAALASGEYNLKLNEVHSGTLSSDQAAASYGAQQVDPYATAQMWSTLSQYPEYAANVYGAFLQQTPAASVPGNMVSDSVTSGGVFNHISGVNHVTTAPSHVPTQEMAHHQGMTARSSEQKDIVDEREDRAIEQSLKDFENMELESQHSYASALNSAETAGLSQESQHSYGSSTDHTSYYTQSSHRPPSTSVSQPAMWQMQSASKSTPSEKAEASHFTKCDDISLESGTARLSSSLQSVGPQTLQGYLDSLPESREYKEAMQSRNPKKGWKPIDGKHITSGKKVAFKPLFWDNEGRMRHGVRVRGSDKSEECWRHVEGKAPAGCTFAHSRLGDTLQFICVKCTYERGPNDWCSEKTKHKQYIFNLGAYRNLEGGIWKKTS